jgi:hypothetical protein
MTTVDRLMEIAFGSRTIRDSRSDEYKAGCRAALAYRIEGVHIRNPHPLGSAQFDAFCAGLDEGHRRWRDAKEPRA